MSGWRAGLVGIAVGGVILATGWFLSRSNGEPGSTAGTASPGAVVEVDESIVLACAHVLIPACDSAAEILGVASQRWRPGDPLPEEGVLVAPAAELPAGSDSPIEVAASPIVLSGWRTRWQLLERECGAVDPGCLARLLGSSWSSLGGSDSWGDVKLGLADPTRSESGLLAWATLAPELGAEGLAGALRLSSTDDATLMAELVQFGDSRADVVITTEVAVIGQFRNAIDRGDGRLELAYPAAGPWATYAAVGNGRGADDLIQRLLSEEIAARWTAVGLRPVGGLVGQAAEGMGEAGERSAGPDQTTREELTSVWEDFT
ncbi:MAG: substrate-binding domain-containing protein [Acidimicrobiia bacterium]|nr:substrate-binding domain-containing protein [Acidimicrobiia bacterium]